MKLCKDKNNSLLCECGNNYFEEVKLRQVDATHLANWADSECKRDAISYGQEIPRGMKDGTTHALKCCSCGKLITALDVKESKL